MTAVVSCGGDQPDIPDIPNIGDSTSTTAQDAPESSDPPTSSDPSASEVYDEVKYHEELGFGIIKSYDSEEFMHAYNGTYDGLYALTVDSIYRTKLDIDILRKAGYDDGTFDGYLAVIQDFLKENSPKYLLPQEQSSLAEGKLRISWTAYIFHLIQENEEEFLKNEKLFAVYAFQCWRNALGGSDVSRGLSTYPEVQKKLVGSQPTVVEQRFDPVTCRTVIDIVADENARLVFKLEKGTVRCTDVDTYMMEKGVSVISVPPDYSGDLSIAAQNEYGLFSQTVYYTVKSTVDQIPDDDVNFRSARLEAAVREYLNKPSPARIKKSDLSSITDLFINGDQIAFVKFYTLPLEEINRNVPATVNDFSFSDIENFPCLDTLIVKHNRTGNPSGSAILNLHWLQLEDCGISDLSGLSGCNIKTLWLAYNDITDASVLSSATALETVLLSHNPLSKVFFPSKAMVNIDLYDTRITDLSCLEGLVSLFSFDCDSTEVSDILPLTKVRNIRRLFLPANADYKIVLKIPTLTELMVGNETIK